MMRLSIVAIFIIGWARYSIAFVASNGSFQKNAFSAISTTMNESTIGRGSDSDDIPTNLPSDVGMDYIPLATLLATGNFEEADQFTRDALIVLSGSKAAGRDFVYFTEVKRIPNTDLATIERLWNRFSKGKFGYSVQKQKWKVSKGDFEIFCQKNWLDYNGWRGRTQKKMVWCFGVYL